MTNARVVMHEARTEDNGKTWEAQQMLFSSDDGMTWKSFATGGIVPRYEYDGRIQTSSLVSSSAEGRPGLKYLKHPIPSGRYASSPHPANPPRSETDMKYPDATRYFRDKYPNPPVLWESVHDTKPIGRIFKDTHDTVEVLRSVDDFLREAGVDKRKRAKAMSNPDPYAAAAEALGCTREEAKKQMLSWSYGWTASPAPDTLPNPHED